jgi:DNA-binding response OmpR family regulator
MESNYRVFVVDDDNTARLLLNAMLGSKYEVECFESAELCLSRLAEQTPDLFLLDVGLPGIDGFELCRRIKANPDTTAVPVVFLSGHDNSEDILAGYDAGGQDYIVKPFDIIGLHHKIENLQRIEHDKRSLTGQAQASDELASLVMANLDEYAVLIKFLRTLNECGSTAEVVEAILRVLGAAHLEGAVQVRLRNLEKTYSQAGENWPLEVAVMNHVRTLERIFEFKRRAAYNFDHITLLITNMPVEDSDLCGRIRDNLAIAAESADAKLAALQSFADNATMREEIHGLLQGIGHTVESFGAQYDSARFQGSVYTQRFLDDLLAAFAHLGMSSQQEEEILELVKQRSNGLIDLYDIAGETQDALGKLSVKLESILAATDNRQQEGGKST